MAEYYGITDLKSVPVDILATLAEGLPGESRSIRKMTGRKLTLSEELLAAILDGINILIWQRSKDGMNNRNRPESVLEKLAEKPKENDTMAFSSGDAFEAYRKRILEKAESDARE